MGKTKKAKPVARPPISVSQSLEELAREQGVTPVTDLDALGELWPKDDDPDEFAAFIASERAARRRLVDE